MHVCKCKLAWIPLQQRVTVMGAPASLHPLYCASSSASLDSRICRGCFVASC